MSRDMTSSREFFEGWYFKHQKGEQNVAFIPGVSVGRKGERKAFLQIITGSQSYNVDYPFSEFKVSRRPYLRVELANNLFSMDQVRVDIDEDTVKCVADIRYRNVTPVRYDVMGPFKFVPFMECRHGVLSLKHDVGGFCEVNDKRIELNGGVGYVEKDWGSSFPSEYTWIQCNDFGERDCSVMASVADIPFMGTNFRGCICCVYVDGREHRLATYNGVKVMRCDESAIVLRRGNDVLEIETCGGDFKDLFAPVKGSMTRTIKEAISCRARFVFSHANEVLFDLESEHASFEHVLRDKSF